MADAQGKQADPQSQQMFEVASRQAAKALTSPQGAKMVYQEAKSKGPDAAIANAVKMTMQQIAQAAKGKGVTIPPAALQAAGQAVAQVLVALMVQAGMAQNPEQLMAAVMQKMGATA